ncbi:MAG: ATP-binding protein [Planctomycetota bacterium]|jgi:signal transduction histidine kinase/GTPase SAR1 family protein
MSQIEAGHNILNARVVYWGPAGGGKTATLAALRRCLDPEEGFHLYSLAAADHSTLLFDLLPVEEFRLGGYRIRTRVIAVPGAPDRSTVRLSLLRGADAVVFVADPQTSALEANVQSWRELEETLLNRGIDPQQMPLVLAYNKQDLADTLTLSDFRAQLGLEQLPAYEAVATDGRGVFEAFSEVFRRLVALLVRRHNITEAEAEGAMPARILPQLVRGAKPPRRSKAQDRHLIIQVPAGVPAAEETIQAQLGMAEAHIEIDVASHMLAGRNRELMAVNRVARSILSAMEADNLLVVLLDATADHLGVSHATCVLFDPTEAGSLRTHVLGFGRDPALGLQGAAAQKFFELIRTSDGPVPLAQEYNPDLLAAIQGVDRRITRAMYQPVKANDNNPAGWIGIYGTGDEPQLSTQAMLFLSSISRLAALGLEKIGLLDKAQRFSASLEEAVHERTGQLEMANAKIRALNRGLEARVNERTRALEEANRQLKEARAGSVHSARMRGMGQIAASFAQEVNNPVAGLARDLQSMRESLDDLRARVATDAPQAADGLEAIREFEEIIGESQESVRRVTGIVASLERLGGEGDQHHSFSLNAIVADAATLLEERVRVRAELELRLGSVPELAGDHQELSHVVLGLLTNAIEAIERQDSGERGRISVTTFSAGDKITLTVKDDGCGIDQELMERIFEPFTTTKEDPSAGLGLHCAYLAAERRDGSLRVRSKPGEGTTVTMVLPVAATPADKVEA